MPFTLSRGGRNVPAEVQRWQYFLRKQGIAQVGSIDADFGIKTETATKFFQVAQGIPAAGKVNNATLTKAEVLGYTVLPDDYYRLRSDRDFPKRPNSMTSPTNASRNATFTCFNFKQLPRASRPDAEAIVIKGSCDDSQSDWVDANIATIKVPQLQLARGGTSGEVRCHYKTAPLIAPLFQQWEKDDQLHLILSYDGCFTPRYKRRLIPKGDSGHGPKKSQDVSALSNHSFGSALDINYIDNQLGDEPALCGQRGSVRELVASANALGVYWGGHFGTPDGMHFEISKIASKA